MAPNTTKSVCENVAVESRKKFSFFSFPQAGVSDLAISSLCEQSVSKTFSKAVKYSGWLVKTFSYSSNPKYTFSFFCFLKVYKMNKWEVLCLSFL